MKFARFGQHGVPGQAGHALVGEDHGDLGRVRQDLQRLRGLRRGEDAVLVLEQIFEGDQDIRLVVDGQDRTY